MYPAHIRINENGSVEWQSVRDHCAATAARVAQVLSITGLESTAEVAGCPVSPAPRGRVD